MVFKIKWVQRDCLKVDEKLLRNLNKIKDVIVFKVQ